MPTRRRSGSRSEAPLAFPPERVLVGRAWLSGRLQPVEVGLDETGRIVRIGRNVPGGERRDFGDMILMPSGIDLHAHLREPGPEESADNYLSGTEQAAVGGIGLVGDMPNSVPPTDRFERLEAKASRARGRLAVDLFLYALARTPDQVKGTSSAAAAYKLYESPTTGVDAPPSPETLPALLAAVADTGLPLAVHAEDPTRFRPSPAASDLEAWDAARPAEAELSAIERLLPAPLPLRLHIAHVTTRKAAERAREAGHSSEATPHHLLLSRRRVADTRLKVNPPLRSERERTELFEAFRLGLVPILASDHAPHLAAEKDVPFDRAPSGMPGLETMLPLFLNQVRLGTIDFPTLLRAACDRPARWMGVPLGRIAVGHRANLLAVDFRERVTLSGRRLHAPCGWTAFEGWEAIFPRHHLRDGLEIATGTEFVGKREGTLLRPEYARGRPPVASPSR